MTVKQSRGRFTQRRGVTNDLHKETCLQELGELCAQLDGDPRHPFEVFVEFFAFTAEERLLFSSYYNAT